MPRSVSIGSPACEAESRRAAETSNRRRDVLGGSRCHVFWPIEDAQCHGRQGNGAPFDSIRRNPPIGGETSGRTSMGTPIKRHRRDWRWRGG